MEKINARKDFTQAHLMLDTQRHKQTHTDLIKDALKMISFDANSTNTIHILKYFMQKATYKILYYQQ